MAMKKASTVALLGLGGLCSAQNATAYSSTNSLPQTYTTTPTTSLVFNVDDFWDLFVGPVSTANTTTTVEATAVPESSLYPPPPIFYPPFPTGHQNPVFETKNESWKFPKDFLYGVAGAAYQIEGAVRAEGRGPANWDVLAHRVTDNIVNNYTADIANNNYYLYKQDIARIAAIGMKAYSFSISWSRIMPFGKGPVNQAGIDHYNDLINTCLQYNITPTATLYHWDTPLYLQDTYGAWLSEEMVTDFVEYARVAYAAFGDRVKYWFTVNEPIVFCQQYPFPAQYFKNFSIPGIQQQFHCGQTVLLAHSAAYRLGKEMMPDSMISYKNNGGYKIQLTNSSDDAVAVQRAWDFNEGWFSDPVYRTGDYNDNIKAYVSSFLRPFTEAEKQRINGSADFYAHDAYTAQFYFAPDGGVDACVGNDSSPLYPGCFNTSYTYPEEYNGWLVGPAADPGSPWLHRAYDWLPPFLHYMQDTWPSKGGIALTEFGFSEPFEALKTLRQDILTDPVRTSYFYGYMRAILIALAEDVNVFATLAWSLYDNFEWNQGYASRFGLQYCNFSDPARPRYFKASFFEYKRAFDLYLEQ